MAAKRAAGFVILRKLNDHIEYLMLKASYGDHHWTPPKGHVDPGEDDMATALRETHEESGFTEQDLIIFPNITKTLDYRVKNKDKSVVYWLAELRDVTKAVTLSEEHEDLKWVSKEDIVDLCGYEDFGDMIEEFHAKYLDELEKLYSS
ncbi:bis(5'-nucleosyl)-tetraphosphatase [asymmetrical] [Culicoides brevitarsis]|uniref:bis(5'-nucleosyl)-tetraphosphatase [asymmetrical] n=1 Tax=Culicoides brevitarsis TaxID=469753 RepID=UPI00307C0B4E